MHQWLFLPIQLMDSVPYRRSLRWDYSLGLFTRSHRDRDETPSWVRNPNTRRCVTRGGKRIVTPPIGLRTFAKKGCTYLLFTVRLDQNKRFAQVCGIAWRPIRSKFKGSFPAIDACIGLSSRVRRSSRSRPMPRKITDFRSCPRQYSKFVTTRVRLLS